MSWLETEQQIGQVLVKMLAHMTNRLALIPFKHDVNDWLVWGSQNGVHSSILGFINFMPKLLWKFDAKDSNPQPSPRAWSRLSDIIKGMSESDKDLMPFHAQSNVGIEAGLEFMNFVNSISGYSEPCGHCRWQGGRCS